MVKRSMYSSVNEDRFPRRMKISFIDDDGSKNTLEFEKKSWTIDGDERGLRYGENPDQQAALYRLVAGNLSLGEVRTVQPGAYLASNVELLQSGKHPGKINITDADSALNILRHFMDRPAAVIVKHNNPSGVALGETLEEAYQRALMADRIAAFGGVVAVNGIIDGALAEAIISSYSEVVVAPDFEPKALTIFSKRKNLRVLRIENMKRLSEYAGLRYVDFHSLMDGGLVLQWSYLPIPLDGPEAFKPAEVERGGRSVVIKRSPTERERTDMRFGWLVESGVTSNSVLYVKDLATVAIGTGEQDRVGVAEIARDKAYRKAFDRISFQDYGTPGFSIENETVRAEIEDRVAADHAGISGSIMVSDAFFPFCDGAEVGLREGASAIIQPGGALRDHEIIELCNRYGATMVFTGQRSFRH